MASTPSAAAALVRPVPSELDALGQTTQIANLMQAGQEQRQDIQAKQLANQQSQMELASQKAMMTAMQNLSQQRNSLTGPAQDAFDGSFYDRLADEYQKQPGAMPDKVLALRQAKLKYETDLADKNEKDLKNQLDWHNGLDDDLAALQTEKDPAKQAALFEKKLPIWKQQVAQFDPSFGTFFNGLQYQGPDTISHLATLNGALTHQTDRVLKDNQAAEAAARAQSEGLKYEGGTWWKVGPKGELSQADISGISPAALELSLGKTVDNITSDPGLRNTTKESIKQYLSQNNYTEANKAVDALRAKQNDIDAERLLEPMKREQAAMLEQIRNGPLNDAQKSVVLGPVSKETNDYAKIATNIQQAEAALAQAKDGSQLANALVPLQTLLGITADAKGVRMNMGLVNALGPNVGNLARNVQAMWDKAATGKLPEGTLEETRKLLDMIADTQYQGYQTRVGTSIDSVKLPPGTGGFLDKDGEFITAGELMRQRQASRKANAMPPGWTPPPAPGGAAPVGGGVVNPW